MGLDVGEEMEDWEREGGVCAKLTQILRMN